MSDWRILLGLFLISQTQLAQAQFDVVDFREVQDKPKPAPIVKTSEIPIEPRVIDPIDLMPKPLQEKVTVKFEDASPQEVLAWIKQNINMPVVIDEQAMKQARLDFATLVNDELVDAPVFHLLNRLAYTCETPLGWYVDNGVLYVTTKQAASDHMVTTTYDISALLTSGYSVDSLIYNFEHSTTGPWFEIDGNGGTIDVLGQVLFVRHNSSVQREIQLLSSGLESHGLVTYVNRTAEELDLVQKLDEKFTLDIQSERLSVAVEKLREITKADIRLDLHTLKKHGVQTRELCSVSLQQVPLRAIVGAMIKETPVDAVVRDGVLWITTLSQVEAEAVVALYDVRDLSRDDDEADALLEAIMNHTSGPWYDVDGTGASIDMPKPGVITVKGQESTVQDVANVLAIYREALTKVKPIEFEPSRQLTDVITRYYRLNAETAESLETSLPTMVAPDSWRVNKNDAKGTIQKVAGGTEFLQRGTNEKGLPQKSDVPVNMSVLIISQTRENHIHIGRIIQLIQHGDPLWTTEDEAMGIFYGGTGGGGGFGGAIDGQGGMGFGGGFFAVPKQFTLPK